MKTYQYYLRLVRYSLKYFITDFSTASVFWLSHTVLGLILQAFFNFLTGEGDFRLPVGPVVGLQIGYSLITAIMLAVAILANTGLRYRSMTLMMRNMFARILEMPGARPLPIDDDGKAMSSGKVISTFRDDTNELVNGITVMEDALGLGITSLISLVIMLRINVLITLGTFIPLSLIIIVAQLLGPRVKKYRKASREATSQVTGAIADMFNNTQAIKVGNAEERVIKHFRTLNDQRKNTMVKDKLLSQIVDALSHGTNQMGVGLILLLAAQAMYKGEFTVGDFALFAAYLWPMTQLVRMTGGVLTIYKQSGISLDRMEKIMQGAKVGGPVADHPVYLNGKYPPILNKIKTADHRLERLTVNGLAYYYPSNNDSPQGIENINLDIQRGTFTVVTGRIGSGKSTLVKALLGLLPAQAKEIRWNGRLITDPASFFTPPRCAYTGQVPRLFSESLKDNILLGLSEDQADIYGAVNKSVMEKDLLDMGDGLATLVGPRGIRLSGGQVQRTAAARMFVRDAELLVFDDLSSALDVETEQILWDRVFGQKPVPTCLVVSHRRTVLERADHIIVLKEGRVEDEGSLTDLLDRCEEMRRLWTGDL